MNEAAKAELKKEQKLEKKIKRLLKKSAWAVGIGIGFILLKIVVVPFIGDNELAEKALNLFGWCLIVYGSVLIMSFLFMRKFMFKVNFVLTYAIMPVVFFKLFLDLT